MKRKYTKRSAFWNRKPNALHIAVPTPKIEQEFLTLAIDHGIARTEALLKRVRAAARGLS